MENAFFRAIKRDDHSVQMFSVATKILNLSVGHFLLFTVKHDFFRVTAIAIEVSHLVKELVTQSFLEVP